MSLGIEQGMADQAVTRRNTVRLIVSLGLAAFLPLSAAAMSAGEIERRSRDQLQQLYRISPKSREVAARAKGILIFPKIVKAGLVVGGESGDGLLMRDGVSAGYFNISTLSVGLQAGAQSFAYVLFLMTDTAIAKVTSGDRWDIGTSPNIVVVDAGFLKEHNTFTLKKEVYAFPFGQKGLMAGLGLQGTVIQRVNRR